MYSANIAQQQISELFGQYLKAFVGFGFVANAVSENIYIFTGSLIKRQREQIYLVVLFLNQRQSNIRFDER